MLTERSAKGDNKKGIVSPSNHLVGAYVLTDADVERVRAGIKKDREKLDKKTKAGK